MDFLKGGFLATVPCCIGTEETNFPPQFAGFPVNIVCSHVGPRGLVIACYKPDANTFSETGNTKEMVYVNEHGGEYSVNVRLDKISGAMETIKYRGEEEVSIAEGPDFESAMLQATMIGLQPGERVTLHNIRTAES